MFPAVPATRIDLFPLHHYRTGSHDLARYCGPNVVCKTFVCQLNFDVIKYVKSIKFLRRCHYTYLTICAVVRLSCVCLGIGNWYFWRCWQSTRPLGPSLFWIIFMMNVSHLWCELWWIIWCTCIARFPYQCQNTPKWAFYYTTTYRISYLW